MKVTREEPRAHLHLQLAAAHTLGHRRTGSSTPSMWAHKSLPLFFLQGHQLLDYPLLFLSVQHHVSMGSFLFLPDSLSSPIFKTALRPTPLCSFPWSCSLYTGFLRIPRPSKSSTHNSLTSSSSHSMLNKYTKQLLLGSWLTFVSTQPRGLFVVLFLGP